MKRALISVGAALLSTAAPATEGGGSIYPLGSENYVCCALPPPGVYGMVFVENYSADKAKGNDGQVVTPSTFSVNATALAPRIVYVTPITIAGASLAMHAILPIVNLDVKIAPGLSQNKTGLGDLVFGPALGWHLSPQLHTLLALDFFAPTGDYNKGDLANIGRNYWSVQPIVGVSYIDATGPNADAKVMYTYNFKNNATEYKSGQEFIVDYDLGWGLGSGWTLGAGGYIYQQATNDRQHGATIEHNKARSLSVGPSIKYDSGKGWFVTAKYQVEREVRNRTEGSAFLLKAVVPF